MHIRGGGCQGFLYPSTRKKFKIIRERKGKTGGLRFYEFREKKQTLIAPAHLTVIRRAPSWLTLRRSSLAKTTSA